MNFNDGTIDAVHSAFERVMTARKPVITEARLAPTGDLQNLSLDQIYWACCRLHQAHWLRNRPLFRNDHVYVSWEPSRQEVYD
jgi:hypothetical protein